MPCSGDLLLSAMCAADTLLGNLTVYEQLLYTSELKNSQKESLARKKERVDIVIDQLAMESCKGVRIGSALKRGISGAQSPSLVTFALVTWRPPNQRRLCSSQAARLRGPTLALLW